MKSDITPISEEMWEAWQEEDYIREMGDGEENDKN